MFVYVCVCVREREREGGREKEKGKTDPKLGRISESTTTKHSCLR